MGRMRYPLLVLTLLAVWKSAYCQPCKICRLQNQDKPCVPNEPMTLPDKIVISPSICNDIEVKNKEYHKKLCETYTSGYYSECTDPKYGNTYSCRSSCGPSVEDIGKDLNLNLLQNFGGLFPNSDNGSSSTTTNNNSNGGGQPNLFDFNVFKDSNPSSKFSDFGDLNNLFNNLNPRTKSGPPAGRRSQPPTFDGGPPGSGFKPAGSSGPTNPGKFPSGQYLPQGGPSSASLTNANSDAVSIPDNPQPLPVEPNPALPPVASLDPPTVPQLPAQSVAASFPQSPEVGQTSSDSGDSPKSGQAESGGPASDNKSPLDFFGSVSVLGKPTSGNSGVGTGTTNSKKPGLSGLRNPFDDPGSPFSKIGQGNTKPFSQGYPDSSSRSGGSKPTDASSPFGGNFGDGFFNYGSNHANNNRKNGFFDPSGAAQPSLNNRGRSNIPFPSSPGDSNFLDEKTPDPTFQSFSAPSYDQGLGPINNIQFPASFGNSNSKPGFNNPGSQENPFPNSNPAKSTGS